MGGEAIKVQPLLIDDSRLPLLRKIGTCGKSAFQFVHCRKGGVVRCRLPKGEKNWGRSEQVFPAAYASEESSEPWEGVLDNSTNWRKALFPISLIQRSDIHSCLSSMPSPLSIDFLVSES